MQELSFYNSHHATTLQEKFNVRFSLHESYHAQFSGRVEKVVGVVKRSFASFKRASLNYHHMYCLLTSIARTMNDRPISLFRAQTLNSPLNVVTPRALMFCSSKPVNKFYLMRTSFDSKMGDNSYVMTLLKSHSTKILQLFSKYILESYHRKVDDKGQSYEYRKLKMDQPILFNPRRTGVKYSYKLLSFGVVDEIKLRRNSDYPRTVIVRTFERGKIIRRPVRPEDIMILETNGNLGHIKSEEIETLQI